MANAEYFKKNNNRISHSMKLFIESKIKSQKKGKIKMKDYQDIIISIRAILNNEDLCAEAMVAEIGELVF